MKEKQIKLPGRDHPISIQRNPARVVVSVAGGVVADTRNALTLRESAYPPVQYIPGEDVDFSQLERTDRRDEIEAEWNIITPIEEAWAHLPAPHFPNYGAGSEGPAAWHELLARFPTEAKL